MISKFVFTLIYLVSLAVNAEPLTIVTEDLPPFNYIEDGKVMGLSSDIVRATLQEAKLEYRIELMRWDKAYFVARFKPNVLIYSIEKNPKRKKHFRWIGQIVSIEFCMFRLKGRSQRQITTLEEAKNYRVGAAFGSAGEQLLINKGFVLGQNLIRSPDEQTLEAALGNGTIDLWFALKDIPTALARRRVQDVEQGIVGELCMPSEEGLYMALSNGSDPAIGDKLTTAFKIIKTNGVYEQILVKHRREARKIDQSR